MTVSAPFDPLAARLAQNPRPMRISACMIAKNAEHTIAESLLSLRFCDQIVVIVDDSTSDRTEEIARGLAHYVERRPWQGFAPAWRYALSKGEGHWLLMIAADEVVTPVLAQSILEAIALDEHRQLSLRGRHSSPDEAISVTCWRLPRPSGSQ